MGGAEKIVGGFCTEPPYFSSTSSRRKRRDLQPSSDTIPWRPYRRLFRATN